MRKRFRCKWYLFSGAENHQGYMLRLSSSIDVTYSVEVLKRYASRTPTGAGRSVKQQEEQISPNYIREQAVPGSLVHSFGPDAFSR